MEMRFEGKESGEMRMRKRMKVEVGDVCCGGVGMEMGLRRVVTLLCLLLLLLEEEEEFKSFDHFYRDARY